MRITIAILIAALAAACGTTPPGPPEASPRAKAFNHYLMGDIHRRNGRFEEAIEEFLTAHRYAPEEAFLTKQIIRGYLMIHDLENAAEFAEAAVEDDKDDPALWFMLGRIYRQQERYDEASEAFMKALSMTSFNAFIYDELLRAEEESNDLVSVIDIYNKLIQLHPDSAMLHERLGLTYARIGRNEEAREHLQKALALDSELTGVRNLLGAVHLELDENESAAAQFRRFLASEPDNAGAREHFAAALVRLGRYDEALEELNGLCSQADAAPRHHIQRMYVLMRAGQARAAGRVAPPNDAPLIGTFLRAVARKTAGEPYEPLIESLDDAESDVDYETQAYLVDMLLLYGEDATGPYLLEKVEEIEGEGVQSQAFSIIHGRILMAMERDREAEEVLLEALNRFGPNKWVHYSLAVIYDELEDPANTEKHLKACLELDPTDPDVMNFLGYFYAEENRNIAEAERLLNRALEMAPENGFYLDSLGWVYYRQGKAELAIEYIRRAILRLETDDAIVRDHLGDAYLLNGEKKKALEEWERAHRLDPELEGVAEKLRKYGGGDGE